MRLLRGSLIGGSAPNPPGFIRFFSARMGVFVLESGDRFFLSPGHSGR